MLDLEKLIGKLVSLMSAWKELGSSYRLVFLTGGSIVFAIGVIWSFTALDFTSMKLQTWFLPLAISAVAAAVVVNAAEQWFAAKTLKVEYSFGRSLEVSCWATLANVLPVPGALLVRSASLGRAGAKARDNALVLGAGAIIWVLLTIAMVAFAIAPTIAVAAFSVLLILFAITVSVLLGRRFVSGAAAMMLILRFVLLALAVARLYAFLGLIDGQTAFRDAAVYAGSSLAGQVIGVVPAGIGIVEAVGAGLALMIDGAPAKAFFALSLNRAFGLLVAGLVVSTAGFVKGRRQDTGKAN